MDIVKLKKQIKENKLDNFYILAGEELGVLNMYINKMGNNIVRAEEVADIWRYLTQNTLARNNAIYVVRDDKKFMTNEKAWTNIESKIKNGILVLLLSNIDKRSKFCKQFEDRIIVFEKMTAPQLLKHCQKQLPKTKVDVIEHLIYLCDNDYTRIENEIDKCKRLNKTITKELLEELIIPPKESTPYTFIEALIRGDYYNTIYDLNNLLKDGESGLMLLGLMYSNFRNAILVVGNKKGESGVNGYVAKNIMENLNYQPTELLAALRIIQKYESGIKKGEYEEQLATQLATLEILSM